MLYFISKNKFAKGISSKFWGFMWYFILFATGINAAASDVLVTIKPLELITKEIIGNELTVSTLLNPNVSPHNYHLKPSDIKKIKSAKVLVWIGPDLEIFLNKPLAIHANPQGIQLKLMDESKLQLRSWTSEDNDLDHETHPHEKHHDHQTDNKNEHHHNHHHGNYDPHIWLDSHNALVIGKAITRVLTKEFPHLKTIFTERLISFEKELMKTDESNKALLKQLNTKELYVFHDAWSYFLNQYDIKLAGIFTLTPERQIGAKHLSTLYKTIASKQTHCMIVEPQFKPKQLDILVKKFKLSAYELDPMAGLIKKEQSYNDFITYLAKTMYQCMKHN